MAQNSEQAKQWLAELLRTYEGFQTDYDYAEVVGGYSTLLNEPKLVHLVIRFQPKSEKPEDFRYEYSHFTVFRVSVEPSTGWTLFERLANDNDISIEGSPSLRFGSCTFEKPVRWDSNTYPFYEEWPVEIGLLTGAQDGRLMHEPLLSSNAPVFAGPQQAIDELTRVPTSWRGWAPTVYCLMPDRRCRISGLDITPTSVTGQTIRGPTLKEGLVLKAYFSPLTLSASSDRALSRLNPPKRFEIDEPQGAFVFDNGFFPEHLIIGLVGKQSNQVLDRREFEANRMTALAGDVSMKADENYLRGLIQNGESPTVEFKENVDGNDGWVKTACAFSNGDGGLIIFGVKDDCSVAGIKQMDTDRIANKLRGLIEPFPDYVPQGIEIDSKMIYYLQISRGSQKPYVVKDQGVFIRAQATTRHATRNELLRLIEQGRGDH